MSIKNDWSIKCKLTVHIIQEYKNRLKIKEYMIKIGWKEKVENVCVYFMNTILGTPIKKKNSAPEKKTNN